MMFYDVLAYVLSAFTIVTFWLAGSNNRWTWYVGLVGQALWAVFVIGTQQWGLGVGTVFLTLTMLRNWWLWKRRV